ncbi:hypothetical protein D9V84_10975 [Bacteroidetes/Chlorobi group bacterium Naka2016]|jgi:hypothetical protein|nr:MAG: hypothetical protein D9V84_10975 [Bacteroidetes/Chlorobi group bacterium Naka2016]
MDIPVETRAYLTTSQVKKFAEMSKGKQYTIVSKFMCKRGTKNQLLLWFFLFGAHYIKLKKLGRSFYIGLHQAACLFGH